MRAEEKSRHYCDLLYLPVYNVHFFPSKTTLKIEMRISHGVLCPRLASLISVY